MAATWEWLLLGSGIVTVGFHILSGIHDYMRTSHTQAQSSLTRDATNRWMDSLQIMMMNSHKK